MRTRGAQLYLMSEELAIKLRHRVADIRRTDKRQLNGPVGCKAKKVALPLFLFLTAKWYRRTIARVGWSKVVGSGSNLVAKNRSLGNFSNKRPPDFFLVVRWICCEETTQLE
jgi:hypothetical protein